MNSGHVYILGSPTGTLYIGVTSELRQRVKQHRDGRLSGFAHEHGCSRLLYAEAFETMVEAITREKQLKGWRREKKIVLIRRMNPEFKDLAEKWYWQRLGPCQSIADQES